MDYESVVIDALEKEISTARADVAMYQGRIDSINDKIGELTEVDELNIQTLEELKSKAHRRIDNATSAIESFRLSQGQTGEIIIRYKGISDDIEQELFEYLNLLSYVTDGVTWCSSGTGLFHKLKDFYELDSPAIIGNRCRSERKISR